MKDRVRLLFFLMNEISDWFCADPMVKAVASSELYGLSDLREDMNHSVQCRLTYLRG